MSRKKGKSKVGANGNGKRKGKAWGKSKGSPHSAANGSSYRPSLASPSPSFLFQGAQEAMAPHFSLADEARRMPKHRTLAFEASRKLRHSPVQFVSAGFLQGTIQECMPEANAIQSTSHSTSIAPSCPPSLLDNTDAVAHMTIRSRSPSPSPSEGSSNADQVVFRGRGQSNFPRVRQIASPRESTAAYRSTTPSANGSQLNVANVEAHASCQAHPGLDAAPSVDQVLDPDSDSIVQDQFVKRRNGRPAWEGTVTPWEHRSNPKIGWQPSQPHLNMNNCPHDEVGHRTSAIDDYIQNAEELDLVGNMSQMFVFSHRDMSVDYGNNSGCESASGTQEEDTETALSHGADWDRMQHLEDLSTSSDMMDTVVRILSKRSRESGLHYLCVYEDSLLDDACWLPSTFLTSPGEKRLIQAFEEENLLHEGRKCNSSNSKPVGRGGFEIDDEAIARLLQRQEELGFELGEFFLPGENFVSREFVGDFSRPNKKRQARVHGNREKTFPSASAMVDALTLDPYDGFDIMDTERPSLKFKKKARRGKMPPELESSELSQQLQNAWESDRAKKRSKKAERELLRQQGLLGRGKKTSDLNVKYQAGIHMRDVVEEICEFLLGDTQSLALPPMEAGRRANVHQISRYFHLTSRSRGDGPDRFTIITKNSRTRIWTNDELRNVMERKDFYKRLHNAVAPKGFARSTNHTALRFKGDSPLPQISYKDGETVGANAPKLGPENKGHILLEKMGWSKGTGLGVYQTGILEPISHKIKKSRIGVE